MQDTGRHSHSTSALTKVARRASVMKRRKFSKNNFDLSGLNNHIDRKESDASNLYLEEHSKPGMLSRPLILRLLAVTTVTWSHQFATEASSYVTG